MVAPGCANRRPESACSNVPSMRSNVDLPDPLRPTRHTRSPAATLNAAPLSNGVVPNVRWISCRDNSGGGMTPAYTGADDAARGDIAGTHKRGYSVASPLGRVSVLALDLTRRA